MSSRETLFEEANKAAAEYRWTEADSSMKKLFNEEIFAPETKFRQPTMAEHRLFNEAAVKIFDALWLRWDQLDEGSPNDGDAEALDRSTETTAALVAKIEAHCADVLAILDVLILDGWHRERYLHSGMHLRSKNGGELTVMQLNYTCYTLLFKF